jgi:hypothetical protein
MFRPDYDASKIGAAMLELSGDWSHQRAGTVVCDLIDQIDSHCLQVEAARYLIWTYFDLLYMTLWRHCRQQVIITEAPGLVWQINDATFTYLPALDDNIFTSDFWHGRGPMDDLIVPIRQQAIARAAAKHVARHEHVDVRSLDELLDFRDMMLALDTNWPHGRRITTMLRLYNRRARWGGHGEALAVRL